MVYNWWTQWFPYFPGMTRIVWIHLIFIRYHVCSRCRLPCCRSHGLLWENGCRIAKAAAANPRGSGAVPAYSSSRFCKCGRSHWVGVIVLGSLFQIGTGFGRFRSSIPRTNRPCFLRYLREIIDTMRAKRGAHGYKTAWGKVHKFFMVHHRKETRFCVRASSCRTGGPLHRSNVFLGPIGVITQN